MKVIFLDVDGVLIARRQPIPASFPTWLIGGF